MVADIHKFLIGILAIIVFGSLLVILGIKDSELQDQAPAPDPTPPENQNLAPEPSMPTVPAAHYCGDGQCDSGEGCASCPNDCGVCPQPARILREDVTPSVEYTLTEQSDNTLEERRYTWQYGGVTYAITADLDPETRRMYEELDHSRDFDIIATSQFNHQVIPTLAKTLKEMAEKQNVPDNELPAFIATFVQSLPYTSDDVTTGYDEYRRFPYETIYDNGGDCEDTAILTAALLKETGYGTILLGLPRHVAVGVACDNDVPGSSVTHQGRRYCYLETTGEGWEIGEIPEQYQHERVTIYTMSERPQLRVGWQSTGTHNRRDVYVNIKVNITNTGSRAADNVKVYVALQTADESKVWAQVTSEPLQIPAEGGYTYTVSNLHAPAGEYFRIYVRAYGDTVASDEMIGDWEKY